MADQWIHGLDELQRADVDPANDELILCDITGNFSRRVKVDTLLGIINPAVADHGVSGQTFKATAGETVALGEVCYLKNDSKYWKAKADDAATMPGRVMATAAISADATGIFLKKGFIRDDSGWGGDLTVGGDLYVSAATAGAVTQTAPSTPGDQMQIVGYAYAARIVFFNPNPWLAEVP